MSSSSCNGAQKKRRLSPSLSNKMVTHLTLLEMEKKKEALSKKDRAHLRSPRAAASDDRGGRGGFVRNGPSR
eukprot:1941225-Prorocentrum_lima.AAC.1